MLIEIYISILAGIFFGIFTGLMPGIHINLVAVVLFSLSPFLLKHMSPVALCTVIVSMAVTHSFLDILPSIFLGAPEAGTALAVLPGHRLLLNGKGYEAVMLTIAGSFGALAVSALASPFLVNVVSYLYPFIQPLIGYILVITCTFLIMREKEDMLWPALIFFMAGCLGCAVFSLKTLKDPLFPMLSGLFGISTLIISLKDKVMIPKQIITQIKLSKLSQIKVISSSVIAGWVCSFMPGIGPSEAAILASQMHKKLSTEEFLMLTGGLGTTNIVLSFVTFYSIDKARNGAVVTISKIIETLTFNHFIVFLAASLVAGGVSVLLASKFSKIFSTIICKVNYCKLCLTIIFIIITLVFIISGWLGLVVLFVSSLLGIIPSLKGTGKNHMMGCLLVPIIIYFMS